MRFINFFIILPFLFSCKKDKATVDPEVSNLENGILVLCEGLFQQNNAAISWIDLTTGEINNHIFQDKAQRELGDTGNDIQRYGGKIYVVVNVSSTIEVLDASTLKSVKQITMMNGSVAKEPRFITFQGANAYVSCFDGYVDVIDTVSLTVTQRIAVGANPEGLCVSNNKLYVANSGGLNFPNLDSTLSVIDLNSNQELYKIIVGKNPGSVSVAPDGSVYVIRRGDYSTIPSRLVKINTTADQVETTFSFDASGVAAMNSYFLIPWTSGGNAGVSLFDPGNGQLIDPNFINGNGVTTLYDVQYDPVKDKIYVMDAMNYTNTGYVRVYSSAGAHMTDYHVGLNPTGIICYE